LVWHIELKVEILEAQESRKPEQERVDQADDAQGRGEKRGPLDDINIYDHSIRHENQRVDDDRSQVEHKIRSEKPSRIRRLRVYFALAFQRRSVDLEEEHN
jgi:hypothetical protein